uniref:Uncharacterized protein n=1 Tax=Arundo donax TaxID=35708 RepID=A0A0A9BGL2_ARUDO
MVYENKCRGLLYLYWNLIVVTIFLSRECIDVSFLDELFVIHAPSYYTQHKTNLLNL